MSTATAPSLGEKRRLPHDASPAPEQRKKKKQPQPPPPGRPLAIPHEATIAALQAKHDVLAASVISSTQIRKRVASATAHLLAAPSPERPRLVLLHARPAQVCKLVTVVEHCKRILAAQQVAWFQYNQLFDMPPAAQQPARLDEKGKTARDKGGDDDGDDDEEDDFEVMKSRLERVEKAVLPPSPPARPVKSMRIFLAPQPISELGSRSDVTLQTSQDAALSSSA